MKKILLITAALLALLLPGLASRADRIRLRSGKTLEGILADPALPGGRTGQIRLWVGPAQISLPADEVESITTDTAAGNLLLDAGAQLDAGHPGDGAEKLGQAARQGAPPEQIALLITRYGDSLAEAAPRINQSARDGLSLALSRLDQTSASQDLALTVRRLYLHVALGETDQAEALLGVLGPQYFTQNPAAQNRLAAAILKALDAWAAVEDFASAEPLMQMLQRVDPRRAEGAAIQFYLEWGSCERRAGRYESALRIYTRNMLRYAPEIALERTTSTLMLAEKDARERKALLGVINLYETYGKPVAPRFTTDRLARIWHDEGMVRFWDNRTTEAQAAFLQAEKIKKGSAAHELLLCQYRQRRALLTDQDFAGHLSLGDWCQANGLNEEALAEFTLAQDAPRLAAEAGNKIESIRSKLAEAELAGIMALYEAGNHIEVLDKTARFMREDHPRGYLAQAKQIQDMAREAIKMRKAQRPQQAESLYSQAERAFYEEDYRKARSLLDALTTYYRDTVTYPRAAALAAMVDQKLAVEAMELARKPSQPVATPTPLPRPATRVTSGTAARITNTLDTRSSASAVSNSNAPVRVVWPAGAAPKAAPKASPLAAGLQALISKNDNKATTHAEAATHAQAAPHAKAVTQSAPRAGDGQTSPTQAGSSSSGKRGFFSRTLRKLFGKGN